MGRPVAGLLGDTALDASLPCTEAWCLALWPSGPTMPRVVKGPGGNMLAGARGQSRDSPGSLMG